MGVVLELVEGKDAQSIIDFMNVVAGESDNLSFGAGEFMQQQADGEAAFLQRQRENGGFTLLAWNQVKGGPKLVGLVSVDRGDRPRMVHRAQLAMVVQRTLWGEGVGRRLLELAMRKLEDDQGVEVAHLEVRSDNERAIRLYERFGFEKTGIDRGSLKIDDELVDAHLMSRQFIRAAKPENGVVQSWLIGLKRTILHGQMGGSGSNPNRTCGWMRPPVR